jgi:predicted DNA binding CopG/RHH family protein
MIKDARLDESEKELLASVERGEWRSVKLTTKEKERYIQAARHTLKKDQRINIRLSQMDLEGLKLAAVREGMPYQTFIASILHKYLTRQWPEAFNLKMA